jgi:hypothetical protein
VSLELLYYDPIASKEIRGLDASWKMEWRDFLDCSVGRCGCAEFFHMVCDALGGCVFFADMEWRDILDASGGRCGRGR